MNQEQHRLEQNRQGQQPWRKWGPYVSDRQWGTVREDYSANGDAWNYLSHDVARSRAYRWGEDGIAGISDDGQILCFAPAFWNGRDPILKERLFGLTNNEGNHGEDVKELYYHVDATPTHSYLKLLYKYPQGEFPYERLREESLRRGRLDPEFELIDTGIFADDRYFDIFIEYAKAGPEDILIRLTIHNRGPDAATLHVLPHLWFRNSWSWSNDASRPTISVAQNGVLEAVHHKLGTYYLHIEDAAPLLFTDNDTNMRRLFGVAAPGPFKDAFHEAIIHGDTGALSPQPMGTKAASHHEFNLAACESQVVRLRLSNALHRAPFREFHAVFEDRQREADAFYAHMQAGMHDADARSVQRQAYAGLIWTKQFYCYHVPQWLNGDQAQPPPPADRKQGRNHDWNHIHCAEIISMPDKWEYPWFAAWDLAFHCVAFAHIDPEFAKEQIVLLCRPWYMHPNGELPAYEWNFSDANPPLHAWAAWRIYQIDRKHHRCGGDVVFLERVFHKLLLNFTWWVNRKDAQGRNLFQGGFLGLDNIGVFDRSKQLPEGGNLEQADATSWMAMYCLNLMRIAMELAQHNHVYEDLATKFFEHFLGIAAAMTNMADTGIGLWDAEDEFYYDALSVPGVPPRPLKVRSMVGLIPLFAVETLEPEMLHNMPAFNERLTWYLRHRTGMCSLVSRWEEPGRGERRLLSLLRGHRMKCLLRRLLDETEFLSPYGVRSLSRRHRDHPYTFPCDGQSLSVNYEPGESETGMFGGNSNWRGPIWFPVNFLIIESLQKFHHYYGDDFKIECPTGSGAYLTIAGVAQELTRRLTQLFLRGKNGQRVLFGDCAKLQTDPHFRDYVQFYEYFHGDTGRGLGASHQTGWTAILAKLLRPRE